MGSQGVGRQQETAARRGQPHGAAKDRRRMAREISCVVWPQGRFGEDSRARRAHIAVNNPNLPFQLGLNRKCSGPGSAARTWTRPTLMNTKIAVLNPKTRAHLADAPDLAARRELYPPLA